MSAFKRVNVLGCPFAAISFSETEDEIQRAIDDRRLLHIVTANIDMVMKARRNPSFASTLWSANLVVADGKPIDWAAALLGNPICGRVNGTNLVWSCAAMSMKNGWPIALIGGVGDVSARAALKLKERHPESVLYAIPTPTPLSEEQNALLLEQIKVTGAKIVLVALGAPLQEEWIATNLLESGAQVGIGVGSAFDMISGDRSRAPRWMQNSGFEWFYRMLQEPRRLGKRYLVEDSPFLYHLALTILRSNGRKVLRRYP